MECQIMSDGKQCATINCKDNGFEVKCTEEGKNLCNQFKECY